MTMEGREKTSKDNNIVYMEWEGHTLEREIDGRRGGVRHVEAILLNLILRNGHPYTSVYR
jgi:hypothetical protein